HETQHESSIDASEDRESRLRLSARSMEEICGADAADKNRSVATDESFLRNARRIHAPQLHRKSRAEKQFHPQPIKGIHQAKRSTATSRTTHSARYCCGAATQIFQFPVEETPRRLAL